MAITLMQYWQQECDLHEAARTVGQRDLASAQAALVTAKAKLDADISALQKIVNDVAANRAKLATVSVPSEVTALNNAIRDQIISQHAMQGVILDGQETVASVQADADDAAAAVKRTTDRLAEYNAGLAAEKDASQQRQLLKAKLAASPFDTIQDDAKAARTGASATDAKGQIDANFPAPLQAIAGKRHATRSARLAQLRQALVDAETALGATLADTSGLSGDAAEKATDFRHAEQALRDYATTAGKRYESAVAVLADLQAKKKDPKLTDVLTKQEKLDVAANAARTAAQGKAEPIDAARKAVYGAQDALDAKIVTQIDTDVDKVATDAALKTARDAIVTKANALKSAQDALVASGDRKVLDEWEAVVQDPAWQALIDYFGAMATLSELEATKPADLVSALDKAEDAYATALADAAKGRRRSDALTGVLALRKNRVEAASAAFSARLFSAVRGDSF